MNVEKLFGRPPEYSFTYPDWSTNGGDACGESECELCPFYLCFTDGYYCSMDPLRDDSYEELLIYTQHYEGAPLINNRN